jgi:hypothetical protein
MNIYLEVILKLLNGLIAVSGLNRNNRRIQGFKGSRVRVNFKRALMLVELAPR